MQQLLCFGTKSYTCFLLLLSSHNSSANALSNNLSSEEWILGGVILGIFCIFDTILLLFYHEENLALAATTFQKI